jgi:hypothetical protein
MKWESDFPVLVPPEAEYRGTPPTFTQRVRRAAGPGRP